MTVAELPVELSVAEDAFRDAPLPLPAAEREAEAPPRGIAIICYSGDLEKTWAAMILASTAGAMAMPCKVFVTFWGLQTFVKDGTRGSPARPGCRRCSPSCSARASATGS